MRVRLPSTQALLAFEAAARHLSFRKAAEELHLTHGAIAHQVHALEAEVGALLFERCGRHVVLTSQAQTLVIHIRQALRALELGMDAVGAKRPGPTALVISVLPAFATRWLIPRLKDLNAACPQIDLFLKATADLVTPGKGGVDVALRYGPGRYPGLRSRRLAKETIFPVCSPNYREGRLPRRIAELRRCVLLLNVRQPWEPWLRAAGAPVWELQFGAQFDDAGLVLQAAAEGQGVALARGLLVEDDLRAGRLVRLFQTTMEDDYGYSLVQPPSLERAKRDAVEALESWLCSALAGGRTANA